ncbi:hypothetical protein BZG02_12120 [Labilibaculum filiforme]|uniref:DUF3667 domain-containing protein n=1 Tax=Labilibaculum filiforme TaxID=1940526 RepID=A0A2N3HWR2_9BACT|nr:DUF3667 domain-containing protein [Labilibaculum filiforme]PKQ62468.1 hypothetical protein BZG02_12120 [Labilibaculum filiforme]
MKEIIQKIIQKLPKKKGDHFEGLCANCEHPVSGSYCSNCGQSVKSFQRPFFTVVSESLGDALSLDNRFLHTLWPLIVRPGFITKEFMKGRRARYTPPFRLYLFLTFFAFLLLSHNHKPETASEKNITIENEDGKSVEILSYLEEAISQDSVELDSLEGHTSLSGNFFNVDFDTEPINELDSVSTSTKKAGNDDLLHPNKAIKNLIEMWRLNPEMIINLAFKKLSQLLLVVLPVFALFLSLFYIRRKRYLLEHLLISLNFHSFIFVMVILSELIILTKIEALQSLAFYLYMLIPIQLFLTLKFYYQQSWWKTIVKFILLSWIYNLLLILGVSIALASFVME